MRSGLRYFAGKARGKIVGVNYLYPVLSSEDTLIDVEAFLREGQRNGPGVRRRSGPLRKT